MLKLIVGKVPWQRRRKYKLVKRSPNPSSNRGSAHVSTKNPKFADPRKTQQPTIKAAAACPARQRTTTNRIWSHALSSFCASTGFHQGMELVRNHVYSSTWIFWICFNFFLHTWRALRAPPHSTWGLTLFFWGRGIKKKIWNRTTTSRASAWGLTSFFSKKHLFLFLIGRALRGPDNVFIKKKSFLILILILIVILILIF